MLQRFFLPMESFWENIISKTEEMYNYKKQYDVLEYLDHFDVIQATVTKLADDLGAKGILALTSSGKSAVKMSRYRPKTPIYAFTHKKKCLSLKRCTRISSTIPPSG